jgi:mevalonate kinase
MGVTGRAHAKLILFGEHSAVYGHPAIGVSLPESLTVRLGRARLREWDLRNIAGDDIPSVRSVLARMETMVPDLRAAGRCSVRITSGIARGIGYGSSAALCVALSAAVLRRARGSAGGDAEGGGPASDAAELGKAWALAHDAEQVFHGTPSGVDTGLSLLGGLFAFEPRPPALPLHHALGGAPLWLVTAAVPRDDSCAALIRGLGGRMRAGDRVAKTAIEELGKIAHAARDVLSAPRETDPASSVGAAADAAMEVLKGIGLGNPSMEELISAGKRAGALGGKLSGAGGGGAFYLVAGSPGSAKKIARAVRAAAQGAGITLAAPIRTVSLYRGPAGSDPRA